MAFSYEVPFCEYIKNLLRIQLNLRIYSGSNLRIYSGSLDGDLTFESYDFFVTK